MTDAARAYGDAKIECNFGASGALAQQIAHGAPVDVFLSAAPQPMDELAAKDLILPDTRRDLLGNDIVLIVSAASTVNSFEALASPAVKLLALGDPHSVPAGYYGGQVLTALRLWDGVQHKLVLAKDVRQVLAYVATGNADAGIVYATDARGTPNVRVAAIADPATHAPVVYPIAVVRSSRSGAAARAFTSWLATDARGIFKAHGFRTVEP